MIFITTYSGHCGDCGRFTKKRHTYCPRCEMIRIISEKSIYSHEKKLDKDGYYSYDYLDKINKKGGEN